MVDEHARVDGHGAPHRRVGCKFPDDGGKVSSQQTFHGVGGGFQALAVGLMFKRFRENFSNTSEPVEAVRSGQMTNFLFCFHGFHRRFRFVSAQHDALLGVFDHPSNDAPATDQAMAHRGFPSPDIG